MKSEGYHGSKKYYFRLKVPEDPDLLRSIQNG